MKYVPNPDKTHLITEWCPNCDNESRIPYEDSDWWICEKCGEPLVPCAICAHETSDECNGCLPDIKFKLHSEATPDDRLKPLSDGVFPAEERIPSNHFKKEGNCKCGGEFLEYQYHSCDTPEIRFEFECNDCGAEGYEVFNIEYTHSEIIKKGKKGKK